MIGLGEIGAEIVKRLRAFEMEVLYTKRNRLPEASESASSVSPGSRNATNSSAEPTSWC